jgi:hypothetical protein
MFPLKRSRNTTTDFHVSLGTSPELDSVSALNKSLVNDHNAAAVQLAQNIQEKKKKRRSAGTQTVQPCILTVLTTITQVNTQRDRLISTNSEGSC